MFNETDILKRLNELKDQALLEESTFFEIWDYVDELSEVAMKRVVRKGKIVRKVAVKKKGFKVVRSGNSVKFVRMTQKEKRARRKAARKAWKVGKAARKVKANRSLRRSKVRIKSLYGK